MQEKNWQKSLRLLDNSIWIDYVKLSPLRRDYLSSVVNILTNGLQILHVTKRDFFRSIFFTVINKYDKGAAMKTSIIFGTVYHAACWRVL